MAHPAFGALIAVQAQRMWELLGRPSPFLLVEMGAGNGVLARDVVDYVSSMPTPFVNALRYVALDRYVVSPPAGNSPYKPDCVLTSLVPLKGVVGCFVSNELVDSFPVHRFQIQDGSVREIYVGVDGDAFCEVLGEPSTPLLEQRLQRLGYRLPDGYRGEVNLGIAPWIEGVSDALYRGFVVTVDYGHEDDELYSPARSMGSVQTYYRHTDGGSPYRRVGRQDITAHVDFSQVMVEGNVRGLRSVALLTQNRFLKGIGFNKMMARLRGMQVGQRALSGNRMAMLELVKLDGLGGLKVLVQEKGTGVETVAQLTAGGSEVVDSVPGVPMLRSHHMRLMEARYPHSAFEQGDMWPPEKAL